jgi:hypothetical protein
MAGQRRPLNNGFAVKTHNDLSKATEAELRDNASQILSDADQGIQTAIVAEDGKTVLAVVGLNGTRYLPDPDPDPLDEVLRQVVQSSQDQNK